ncbi:hypothetical protein [Mesorhizobium sp. M0213]|uniref:hypothetical protein n=1 Tax=Mesorhizobium sp. M0213 TaxID=2956917 RepID=UPI00333D2DD4
MALKLATDREDTEPARMVTPGSRLTRSTIFGLTRVIMFTWTLNGLRGHVKQRLTIDKTSRTQRTFRPIFPKSAERDSCHETLSHYELLLFVEGSSQVLAPKVLFASANAGDLSRSRILIS